VILSDADVRILLGKGRLVIEPLHEDTVRENGVDLRLGSRFCRFRSAGVFDTRSDWGRIGEFYECVEVGDEGFTVAPGEHVLAHTLEYIRLPDDLAGLVNLRSTFARLGIFVPPTVVDAGFEGQLTIEIIGSAFPVKLYPGQRFLHVVFMKTTTPVVRPYNGKYKGQRSATPPKPDRK